MEEDFLVGVQNVADQRLDLDENCCVGEKHVDDQILNPSAVGSESNAIPWLRTTEYAYISHASGLKWTSNILR